MLKKLSFSVIDMKFGYHQVEIEEAHKERIVFTVGPLGFYECAKLPFCLSNSLATYQSSWRRVWATCIIYLDDLIIVSGSFEQHQEK